MRSLTMLAHFRRNTAGGLGIVFAISLPTLLVAAAFGINYSLLERERSSMQEVADAAAIAAAVAVGRSADGALATRTADQLVASHDPYSEAETALVNDNRAVRVILRKSSGLIFDKFLSSGPVPIKVSATAGLGISNTCLLVLDPAAHAALSLDSNARIEADCEAQVNSTHSAALQALSNSKMTTAATCVTGNYSGGDSHYTPRPAWACPVIGDPLAGVAEPSVGACSQTNLVLDNNTRTLTPGTYCGGILIKNDAKITFAPGTYIINDGKLEVDGNSIVAGEGVMFYLTGSNSVLYFKSNVVVDFKAPKTGPHAGILFFEARSSPLNRIHYLDSNNVNRIEGTIYLSRGTLSIDSNSTIGAQSKYTKLVVRRLKLNSNAKLVLNSDYEGSDVPVAGASRVALIE